jgi:hypothetical protein
LWDTEGKGGNTGARKMVHRDGLEEMEVTQGKKTGKNLKRYQKKKKKEKEKKEKHASHLGFEWNSVTCVQIVVEPWNYS